LSHKFYKYPLHFKGENGVEVCSINKDNDADNFIKIGITNNKIVSIKWDTNLIHPGFIKALKVDKKNIDRTIINYLKDAIRFMKGNK
jgi:hypothetical protein